MKCKTQIHLVSHFAFLITLGMFLTSNAKAANLTWTGATNGNWGAANWSGGTPVNSGSDSLAFAGSTNRSTTNNLTGYTATGITFNSGAGAFTLAGNAITLAGDITNSSTTLQTITLDISAATTPTITTATGGGDITINGEISGLGGITTTGSGILTLAGSNSYSGTTTLSLTTLRVSSDNALGVGALAFGSTGSIQALGSAITLANSGTFVTLTVSGSQDLAFSGKLTGLTGQSRTITNNIASGKTLTLTNIDISPDTSSRSLTISGTGNTDIVGVIASGNTGNKTLSITNTGTTTLSGINTYNAAATVSAGTLVVTGSGSINASSGTNVDGNNSKFIYESSVALTKAVVLKNGGTFFYNSTSNYSGGLTFDSITGGGKLGGQNWNGTLGGLVIGANATISPGNSPGTAATTTQTWASLGTYNWEINKATGGAAGMDPGWDLINLSSTLTVSATSASKFTINILSLKLDNTAGAATGFDASLSYNWLIADSANAISGFSADKFFLNSGGFSNTFNGTFGIALGSTLGTGDNTQIYLTYTAIPEPSTAALIGLAAGVILLFLRRRTA